MKVYCILCDSIPLGNSLETYLQNKGFHHFTQVSNCFTTTSVISLLTGKLPSDLEEDGIGYGTHSLYQTGSNQPWKVNYPWKNQLMISQLNKAGWDIHFHNADWFYWTICNDNFITKTTSMPCIVECEEKFRILSENYGKLLLNENNWFHENEKEFIKKIQDEKTNKDKFYFIKNNQYHEALIEHSSKKNALTLIEKWFDYWDFEEEDALFWIFSDHHDFTQIDKLCNAPSMLTWACVKKNTKTSLGINYNYIHIKDFYNLFYNKQISFNKNRIYFIEDARQQIDTQKSTTAVACKFVNWSNGKAYSLIQVLFQGGLFFHD